MNISTSYGPEEEDNKIWYNLIFIAASKEQKGADSNYN